jgi:hypothetical protein
MSGLLARMGKDGKKRLVLTLPAVHVRRMDNRPKSNSGISAMEAVIALVLLGLCIAMCAFGVELLRQIQ